MCILQNTRCVFATVGLFTDFLFSSLHKALAAIQPQDRLSGAEPSTSAVFEQGQEIPQQSSLGLAEHRQGFGQADAWPGGAVAQGNQTAGFAGEGAASDPPFSSGQPRYAGNFGTSGGDKSNAVREQLAAYGNLNEIDGDREVRPRFCHRSAPWDLYSRAEQRRAYRCRHACGA